MTKIRVHGFSISIDGFGAGPSQSLENPLGVGGMALHNWAFRTQAFQRMFGNESGGEEGIDNDYLVRGFENIGAWILGRNMFGPVRGPWPDESWQGWWGENPPYHTPVFVLTQHARDALVMEGGTTFHFATEGMQSVLQRAIEAAKGRDVRVGGGVATVKQFLRARVIDEMHVASAPVLLGAGENLFSDINLPALGYECVEHVATPNATHVIFKRRSV